MRKLFFRLLLFTFFTAFLPACALMDGTIDIWSEDVEKVHVTTDPPGAKLMITSVDSGMGATIATNVSPNDVYYTRHPHLGTYLTIRKKGYKKTIIKLDKSYGHLHVALQKEESDLTQVLPQDMPSFAAQGRPDFNLIPGLSQGLGTSTQNISPRKETTLHPPGNRKKEKKSTLLLKDSSPYEKKEEAKEIVSISKTPPPPQSGTIKVETVPTWAPIYLDDRLMGKSPKILSEITPGSHNLKIKMEGYRIWEKEVAVHPGTTERISVKLNELMGTVVVTSNPHGAALFVDGKKKGRTAKKLTLQPGRHKIKLVMEGFHKLTYKFTVKANQTEQLKLNLEPLQQFPGMIYIPPGTFIMGDNEGQSDERPEHKTFLTGYFIDAREVTNGEYRKFLKATGRFAPDFLHDPDLNTPEQPVVGVSWEDAAAYSRWIGKRLPSEAEWEKAARGDSGRKYPFGNSFTAKNANKFGKDDGYAFTAPVDKFPQGKSPYGVFQMSGNVREWCADWYRADYYLNSPNKNPPGPETGEYKIMRGGSWEDGPEKLRAADRAYNSPTTTDYKTGFRCAKDDNTTRFRP